MQLFRNLCYSILEFGIASFMYASGLILNFLTQNFTQDFYSITIALEKPFIKDDTAALLILAHGFKISLIHTYVRHRKFIKVACTKKKRFSMPLLKYLPVSMSKNPF